jgi:serine/threonine protein kinase
LGKGSFGEVRECTNKITGMKIAMKIVTKNSIAQHQVLIDLMESELDVLSKTDHPGIVRVLELLEDDINFYIVSELVNNGELYDYIIQNKMFNEQTAA